MHPDNYNPILAISATLQNANDLLAELRYRSYKRSRDESPHISAQSWSMVYLDAEKMEARYQKEKAGA